jgi:prevent-host-death family protein
MRVIMAIPHRSVMMVVDLPELDQLHKETASAVKNRWRELVAAVHEKGSVAVTTHAKVDLVLVDAEKYKQLSERFALLQSRERGVLDRLSADFEKRIAAMQEPGFAAKVGAVFARDGKLRSRPKAGAAF